MTYGPSDVVGERVREYRSERRWRAQDLAERCKAAGAPELTTAVIANIETGRRDPEGNRRRFITIDEVLILAWVLGVPPVMLFIPLGSADEMAITPQVTVHPSLAFPWVMGEEHPPASDPKYVADHVDMALFSRAAQPIRLYGRLAEAQDALTRAQRQDNEERQDEALRRLAEVLDDMVAMGVRPPAIWHERYDRMVDAGYLRNPKVIERWEGE